MLPGTKTDTFFNNIIVFADMHSHELFPAGSSGGGTGGGG